MQILAGLVNLLNPENVSILVINQISIINTFFVKV